MIHKKIFKFHVLTRKIDWVCFEVNGRDSCNCLVNVLLYNLKHMPQCAAESPGEREDDVPHLRLRERSGHEDSGALRCKRGGLSYVTVVAMANTFLQQ